MLPYHLIHPPEDVIGVEDERLMVLGWMRSIALTITYFLFVVKFDLAAIDDYFKNAVARCITVLFLGGGILLISFLAVLLIVNRELRRPAAIAMSRPVGVMIITPLPFGALVGLLELGLLDLNKLDGWFPWPIAALLALFFLVVYVALVFVNFFVFFIVARYFFAAGLAHPIFPPLLTAITVWVLLLFDLTGVQESIVTAVFDNTETTRSTVSFVLTTIGAATATALAVAEIKLLRARGHRLRTGPWE